MATATLYILNNFKFNMNIGSGGIFFQEIKHDEFANHVWDFCNNKYPESYLPKFTQCCANFQDIPEKITKNLDSHNILFTPDADLDCLRVGDRAIIFMNDKMYWINLHNEKDEVYDDY